MGFGAAPVPGGQLNFGVLRQEYLMDTFEDLQRPFPLFKAPISDAALDGPGNCLRCGSHAGIRFRDACYDCFRSGEIDMVMDTEFGMVTREDARLGRTHRAAAGQAPSCPA